MTENVAVDVVEVSKRFRLYHQKYQSLKERVLHAGSNPTRTSGRCATSNSRSPRARPSAILGRNGSGKSTLLKCVSGILQPTERQGRGAGPAGGPARARGGVPTRALRVARTSILNASLLGMSTKEIDTRFDEIVAFAELEQFIDNQVKYYSSGMYVRLGFAVAVNVDPDMLVVDEVLAVGDEAFRASAWPGSRSSRTKGGPSCSSPTPPTSCARSVTSPSCSSSGDMIGSAAPAAEAVRIYHEHLTRRPRAGRGAPRCRGRGSAWAALHRSIQISSVEVEHPGWGSAPYLLPWEPLTVHVAFEATEPVEGLVFALEIHDQEGGLDLRLRHRDRGRPFDAPVGAGRADLSFEQVPMLDGTYSIKVEIRRPARHRATTAAEQQGFEVMNPGRARGTLALQLHADIRAASLN